MNLTNHTPPFPHNALAHPIHHVMTKVGIVLQIVCAMLWLLTMTSSLNHIMSILTLAHKQQHLNWPPFLIGRAVTLVML